MAKIQAMQHFMQQIVSFNRKIKEFCSKKTLPNILDATDVYSS